MNTKSHTIKQVKHDKPSFFVVEQNERMDTSTEVTMSDIAKKLRSVYAQMQMKHSPRHSISQSPVEERFKSYLDDISRAILAEYSMRRQKEKKLFECLDQIKMLVQGLQSEKKILEEAVITRRMSRSKSPDSVVQHLAHMACEENKERSLLQEEASFSGKNIITPSQKNVENILQQGNKSSLPSDATKLSSKEIVKFVEHSAREERCSDVQESGRCIESESFSSLKVGTQKHISFLRFFVKKMLPCFLVIAFIATITVCFYDFLRGALLNFTI
ncbi:hypothetical protein MEI_01113 [Bartonella vinsonii subsp. arupensis Pm136co]|uniref:Uncharacterized protein n=1 Tax=Bartonella vinsonii subsp. arupensis Pm136co TaxID=1094561 RepID=A0ABP2QSU3_BARVI|nr:hypothetical protein [Bartonella vinsonii]EJF97927.1 hypothetical protein MEI_01113 [Bartonella vinsonii subsp. arupensis Pm136co]